jgi:ATPase subunit of ABC transporter with duplicated ATPase domains
MAFLKSRTCCSGWADQPPRCRNRQWLEAALRDYPGTNHMTHDRYFLDNITKWILELDKGRGLPFEATILRGSAKSELLRITKRIIRQKTLAREQEWINTSASARNVKNQARISSYHKLASESDEDRRGDVDTDSFRQHLNDKVLLFNNVPTSMGNTCSMAAHLLAS